MLIDRALILETKLQWQAQVRGAHAFGCQSGKWKRRGPAFDKDDWWRLGYFLRRGRTP
jgi:hypothetical protein